MIFKGYISADQRLPEQLVELKSNLNGLLKELHKKSGGKFSADINDPDSDGGFLAKKIESESDKNKEEKEEKLPVIDRLIERSPDSARILLFASNSFLSDTVLHLASGGAFFSVFAWLFK